MTRNAWSLVVALVAGSLLPGAAFAQGRTAPGDARAVIVVEHPNINTVNVQLGVVGDPFRPLNVRLQAGGGSYYGGGYDNGNGGYYNGGGYYDGRAQDNKRYDPNGDGPGRRGRGNANGHRNSPRYNDPYYNGGYNNSVGNAIVPLQGYSRWIDGRSQWYLRVSDAGGYNNYPNNNSGYGNAAGRVVEFAILTGNGTIDARNLPMSFGYGRPADIRLVPPALNGGNWNNGGYYDNNGGWYDPNGGYYDNNGGYPNNGNTQVNRSMPSGVGLNQQLWVTLNVNLPYNVGRIDIAESLPTHFRFLQATPPPTRVDNNRGLIQWSLYNPQPNTRITYQLVVPNYNGQFQFRGEYRLDNQGTQWIGGASNLVVGNGNYNGPNNPNYNDNRGGGLDRNGNGRIDLGDLLGWFTG